MKCSSFTGAGSGRNREVVANCASFQAALKRLSTVPTISSARRRAVHPNGDVGPVIRIEASQEDLLSLAATGVLRDDETRNQTKQLLGRFAWTQVQVEIADNFGGRRRVGPLGPATRTALRIR